MTHNPKAFQVFNLALATLDTPNTYSDAHVAAKYGGLHTVPKRHSVCTKQEGEGKNRERRSWIKCYFKFKFHCCVIQNSYCSIPTRDTIVSFQKEKRGGRGDDGPWGTTPAPIHTIFIY